jgi:hypothetical protein
LDCNPGVIRNFDVTNKQSLNSLAMEGLVGVIHFYILYDLDLNANHLRLYMEIESLWSCPDPMSPRLFSLSTFADRVGISLEEAQDLAETLIAKGYIKRTEREHGVFIWSVVKNFVTDEEF